MKTDVLDEQILAILARNARTSNREVARELGVADVTVGKRLNRLQRQGAVRVAAVVDPRALDLNCAAFVRLVTEPAHARKVAEVAAALNEIPFVALMAGQHSIVMLALVKDRMMLSQFLHDNFRILQEVRTIDAQEIVAGKKHTLELVFIRNTQLEKMHSQKAGVRANGPQV